MGQAVSVTAPAPPASPIQPVHLIRTGLVVAPVLLVVAGLWRGSDGVWSAACGLALATANLGLSSASLEWAARISLNMVAAVALGGYIVRLAGITAIVLLMRNLSWVDLPALSISLVVAYIGLLVWEAKTIHQAAEAASGQTAPAQRIPAQRIPAQRSTEE